MKRIDRFLISSFIPPFVVTFFIALFVLILQFLWVYIDDIIGKGVGFFILIELIFYLSISLFPMALPIAVLISSVMVMGNLAEHYELSSFKSAGVPLLRVMAPLMFVCAGVGLFSFFCSNNFIPIANLKFKSRLYDIRKQKPALSLEKGVFNDDFQGTVIHIGNKKADNITIEHVKIYEQDNSSKGIAAEMLAKKGEMYTTADKRYFVMNLFDGTQYQELSTRRNGKKDHAFIRLSFEEWHKVYDLSEFELNRTNEELFKSHQSMLSVAQLAASIDSLDVKMKDRLSNLDLQFVRHFTQFKPKLKATDSKNKNKNDADSIIVTVDLNGHRDTMLKMTDSIKLNRRINTTQSITSIKTIKKTKKTKAKISQKTLGEMNIKTDSIRQKLAKAKSEKTIRRKDLRNVMPQISLDRLDTLASFIQTIPKYERRKLFSRALSQVRSISSQANSTLRFLDKEKESRVERVYEMHSKFSMAVVCFIFLFIGAPMGAIVRKGGFGYPILVAIIFFMLYIVLTIICKKLALNYTLSAEVAAWMPCIILFPIGLLLTYKAMHDSKLINIDRLTNFFSKLLVGAK